MAEPQTAAEWEAFFDQRERARAAHDAMRCAALRGNDALAAAVQANWQPIRDVQRSQSTYEREREDDLYRQCGIVN